MKNKKSLFLGTLAALISVFVVAVLLQFLLFYFWAGGDFEISVTGLTILSPEKLSKIQTVVILSFPIFYIFSTIELAVNLLKHQTVGSVRFTLITFIIVSTGYLIVNFFTGAFNAILNVEGNNSWSILCRNLEFNETGRLIFVFVVILLLMNYLRSFNRIISEYVSYKK